MEVSKHPMKTKIVIAAAVSIFFILHSAFGQGALTPPGAPAPTMKSLDQIEPRTPISSAPVTISASGSYYLTTNVYASTTSGITIATNNVTLDLNGFALLGTSYGPGISLSGNLTNITVRNGSLGGWEFGVSASTGGSGNIVLEHLLLSGCDIDGIVAALPAVVRCCTCNGNGSFGMALYGGGQVTDCAISYNGKHGIYIAAAPVTVTGCFVANNAESGIFLDTPGNEVIGNTCIGNNTGASFVDAGIYVNDSRNRIEANHVNASGFAGISVSGSYTGNIIVKNSVSGNGANNYLTPGNQVVGPLTSTYGIITNSNPWANFSY